MSPERTLEAFFEALARRDSYAIASAIDPRSLERWRRMQLLSFLVHCEPPADGQSPDTGLVYALGDSQLDDLLARHQGKTMPLLPGVTLGLLGSWEPSRLLRELLESSFGHQPATSGAALTGAITIIGAVFETPAIAHVIGRSGTATDASNVGDVEVYTLHRASGDWKIWVSDNLAGAFMFLPDAAPGS